VEPAGHMVLWLPWKVTGYAIVQNIECILRKLAISIKMRKNKFKRNYRL